MAKQLRFGENLAFGKIELLDADGALDAPIPSWLLDRTDVLEALQRIAAVGGTAYFEGIGDDQDVIVDLHHGTVDARTVRT